MDLIICFIDDSSFEHELVRDEIAVLATELKFIQAYTFEEAVELLGKNIPVLFLCRIRYGRAGRRPYQHVLYDYPLYRAIIQYDGLYGGNTGRIRESFR